MDSPGQLSSVLEDCNRELGKFGSEWAKAAGELKRSERRYKRLFQSAMRGTKGTNAEIRQATAHAAVEDFEPDLAARIEELIEVVESSKVRFDVINRQSNNAQSLLASHREAAKIESFVPKRDPNASPSWPPPVSRESHF